MPLYGAVFLVMEYANNGTLYQRLQSLPDRRMSEEAAAPVIHQICRYVGACLGCSGLRVYATAAMSQRACNPPTGTRLPTP